MITRGVWISGDDPGPMLVEVEPELSPEDVAIDLSEFALEVESVSIPRTTTPRMSARTLAALLPRTTTPTIDYAALTALLERTK